MGGQLTNCRELAYATADRWGLPREVFYRLIWLESSCRPDAVSPSGVHLGLGQLGPGVRKDYNVKNPFDPVENLNVAAHYLRDEIDHFKSLGLGIAAYHAGRKTVEKAGRKIPDTKDKWTKLPTADYVRKILGGTPDTHYPFPNAPNAPNSESPQTPLAKLAVNPDFRKALVLGTATILVLFAFSRMK